MCNWKQNLFLQKYVYRCDLHIVKTLRIFFHSKSILPLESQLMPERAPKFARQARTLGLLKIGWQNGGIAERWNGGISLTRSDGIP